MKKASVFLFLFFCGALAWSEPTIKLRMDVSPKEITIGDPVQCSITVIFSSALKPSPLVLPTTGNHELLAMPPAEVKTLPEGDIQMTHRVLLTTFSTGTLLVPSFVLNFITDDGRRAEAKTEPLEIKVNSVLEKAGDEGHLRPLKGLYNFRSYFWLWFALGLLGGAVLIYFLVGWLKKKKSGAEIQQGPPQPAEETAWDALQKLEDSDLLQNGLVKEFYVQLSTILRSYLENRYHISCLDRTTSELLAEIRRLELTSELTIVLRVFIENSDLVKFAKYTPSDEDIGEDLTRVKQFITQTTPQEKVPELEKIPV